GEAAFALGCERPARVGYYLILDVVAQILAGMLHRYTGLQLRQAVEVVREHWTGWTDLVTEVERWHEEQPGEDPRLFIAIAWLALKPGKSERPFSILLGAHDDIVATLRETGAAVYSCNFVSIALVLHCLRVNADQAEFTLPARLTVAQGEP